MTRRTRPVPKIDPVALANGERLLVQQVAQLTGVSRERLRTWERRHGFPEPERRPNNVRTYAVDDIARIVAVSRLIDNGYPVADAIAAVVSGPDQMASLGADGASIDHAPLPVIAVAGDSPQAMRVVWANAATRVHPECNLDDLGDGAEQGDWASRLGDEALSELHEMLSSAATPSVRTVAHIDWVGTFPAVRHSLAWCPPDAEVPCVVLMQLPEAMLSADDPAQPHDEVTARWAAAVAAGRGALQGERGLASAQHAVRDLVAGCGALDGLLVLRHGVELRTASSVRGTVSARAIQPSACPDLADALAAGELRWLDQAVQASFGLPSYLALLALPLSIGGQTVGAVVLSFAQQVTLSETVGELLHLFGSATAAAIQRERYQARTVAPGRGVKAVEPMADESSDARRLAQRTAPAAAPPGSAGPQARSVAA